MVFEGLCPADLDHGDARSIPAFELLVPVDEDLLEAKGGSPGLGLDRRASVLAQVTVPARVHPNERGVVHDRLIVAGHLIDTTPVEDERLEHGTDADLHRRVAFRDRRAFEELYRRYATAAYGLALRVTGQDSLAQDVVHDAFLAMWRAPEAYDPARGTFRAFFLSLVHHRAVDVVRREERLRRRASRVNPDSEVGEDVADDVVRDAWLAVRRRQVRDALHQLPPEQRQVLELAYFGGYTQARIAEELGVPLGTVKTRTFAAMRKLQRLLTEASE